MKHFKRAFSILVAWVFEMRLETRDASEALAAGQCRTGRATCQFGEAAARFMPEICRG